MPSINMIAVRREDKRRQENNIRKLLYAILGEVGVVILLAFVLTARILVTTGRVSELNGQLDKLKPRVAAIQSLQAQTADMMPKVQTLDGAKSDTLFWYKNFYAVTASLPPKTWLTSLGTGTAASAAPGTATPGTAGGGDPTLSLSGIAMSQATVGETMLRMNQAPSLDHVDLAFVQQQKIGAADAVSFQMTVHLKPESDMSKSSDTKGATNGTKS